jgi:hypothetical protein
MHSQATARSYPSSRSSSQLKCSAVEAGPRLIVPPSAADPQHPCVRVGGVTAKTQAAQVRTEALCTTLRVIPPNVILSRDVDAD